MRAPRRRPLPPLVLAAGAATAVVAAVGAPGSASAAAGQVWPAFVLVLGLLLVGFAAAEDGAFTAAARLLRLLPGGTVTRYVVSMGLVALVSTLLNLDTAVTFLTPVLVLLARDCGDPVAPFLYGSVFTANSASLLLPGSNLTNLIVVHEARLTGSRFAGQMTLPWLLAVAATITVSAVALRLLRARPHGRDRLPRAAGHRPVASIVATVAVTVVLLVLNSPALPVLAIGLVTVAVVTLRDPDVRRRAGRSIDLVTVAGLFGLAVAAGALGREWLAPAHALAAAGRWETAGIGALGAVVANNLPAAALLAAHPVAHPRALLIGLDVGPNIAVTGSLSAVLWLQAAALVDARPSARRYTAVGAVVAAVAIPLAVLG